ncbi:MAG: CBS domain-containing protein [Myxococcales bacterium]|nr:CBS domain-containing protein [Myxococcales bacterium]
MRKKPEHVEDIMVRRVEALDPDAPLHDAVKTLLRRGYSGAPVTDSEGTLLGVFSEHDCIKVLSSAVYEGWPPGSIRDHMTTEAEAAAPGDDLMSLAKRFSDGRHRSLPVVEGGKVVGLVGRSDLVRALDRLLQGDGPQTTYELIAERRR